jgi:hypothetical protein
MLSQNVAFLHVSSVGVVDLVWTYLETAWSHFCAIYIIPIVAISIL